MSKKKTNTNKKSYKNNVGIVLVIIQLLLTGILVGKAGMLPAKYRLLLGVILVAFASVCALMITRKNKSYIAGYVVSIFVSLGLFVGILGLGKINGFMNAIGGGGLKTDNMVVVVYKDDEAETLEDASNYLFGISTTIDKENTDKMVKNVGKELDKSIDIKEYVTFDEMASALITGDVDALIYNSAFDDVIEDTVEGYKEKIKVIYQYGITTEVIVEEEKEVDVSKGFNVYISGIDVSGPIKTTSRSDVNIIMSINPETKQILPLQRCSP